MWTLLLAAGPAMAATRAECSSQCVICGDTPVCETIFQNCVNRCMSQSGPAVRVRPVRYAAIAVSESTLKVRYAWDFETQAEANSVALKLCNDFAKQSDCRIAASNKNDVCIALAISGPGVAWAGAWGDDADTAHRYALEECRKQGGTKCFIKQTICPDG
jgi:hypothetical protein